MRFIAEESTGCSRGSAWGRRVAWRAAGSSTRGTPWVTSKRWRRKSRLRRSAIRQTL